MISLCRKFTKKLIIISSLRLLFVFKFTLIYGTSRYRIINKSLHGHVCMNVRSIKIFSTFSFHLYSISLSSFSCCFFLISLSVLSNISESIQKGMICRRNKLFLNHLILIYIQLMILFISYISRANPQFNYIFHAQWFAVFA